MQILSRSTAGFVVSIAVILGSSVGVIVRQTGGNGGLVGIILTVLILVIGFRKGIRRWWIQRKPIPADWEPWLLHHIPVYRHLSVARQRLFVRDMQFFLAEQTFESVGDVQVEPLDYIRVAAGAALMLQGRPQWDWPATRTILFYPAPFDDGYYDSVDAEFDGMVHAQGPVIFYIKALRAGWAHPEDGSNVILHELAHVLDFQHGMATGTPRLLAQGSQAAWEQLMQDEMRRIRARASMLRPYAATNAAEFFAVSVENFFERPHRLKQHHQRLYEALVAFFNLDLVALIGDES